MFNYRKVNVQIQMNKTIRIMIVDDFNLGNGTTKGSFDKTIVLLVSFRNLEEYL